MWEQLIICFVIFSLAAYGLSILLKGLLAGRRKNDEAGLRLAVIVKNREQDIEWIIRKAIAEGGILTNRSGRPIMILDMESEDETLGIAEKLAMEYEELEALPYEERETLFADI